MKKENKKRIKSTLLFLGLAVFFITAFLIIFYFCNPLSNFNKKFFRVIPYPVALVDGKIITTRNLISDTESLKNFYEKQDFSELGLRVDFKTEEGELRLKVKEKEVFNKLIENQIIQKIAKSKGIEVTEKEAGTELVTKAQEAGSTENLALNLKKLYGWKLSDFRDKIILPRLYLGKLITYYEEENPQGSGADFEIEKAYQELEKDITFDEVARKYSAGENAKNGGAIGWFKKEYLSEKIAEKAYSMQPGEFSEIIKTPLGNHIIFLEEIKESEGVKEVKLKQIFTREGSFLDWLNQEKSKLSVKILLEDYYWDKESNRVKFSDQKMEEKESVLRNNSEGDPSL